MAMRLQIKWNKPTIATVVLKSIIITFEMILIMSMTALMWEYVTEDVIWENDESMRISSCETYLREQEYGRLWDYLELYDLEGARYQIYWDAVEERVEEIQKIQENK